MKEMSEQQQIMQTEKESASATNERLATENILLKRKLTQKERVNKKECSIDPPHHVCYISLAGSGSARLT